MAAVGRCLVKYSAVGSSYDERKEHRYGKTNAPTTRVPGVKQVFLHRISNFGQLAELREAPGQQSTSAGAVGRRGTSEKQLSSSSTTVPLKERGGQEVLQPGVELGEKLHRISNWQIQEVGGYCDGVAGRGREGTSISIAEGRDVEIQRLLGSPGESINGTKVVPEEQGRKHKGSTHNSKLVDELGGAGFLAESNGSKPKRVFQHSSELQLRGESIRSGSAGLGKRVLRVREVVEAVRRAKGQEAMAGALRGWVKHLSLLDVNRVLKELHDVDVATSFFTWIKNRSGHRPDNITYTSFLKILVRAGRWDEVEELMEEMSSSEEKCRADNVTYSILIAGGSRAGLQKEVIRWFDHMKASNCRPDVVTYNTVISAFVRAGDLTSADSVFRDMQAAGSTPDTFTYSTLASAYGKAGDLDKALSLFQSMQDAGHQPDAVSYSIMIDACAKQGAADQAQLLFAKMRRNRCRPDAITWNSLLLAYAKANRQKEAEDTLAAMRAGGFEPDKFTYASMMWMYAQAGQHKQADRLLKSLGASGVTADAHIQAAVLSAHANAGHIEHSEELFRDSVERGMQLSQVAFTSMLTMYGRAGLLEKGEAVMKLLCAQGLTPNSAMLSALVDMYGKCGKPMEAVRVFKEMEDEGMQPKLVTYNSLIGLLGNHGMLEAAQLCLSRMERAGLRPDAVTYSSLILACGKAKRVDEALRQFYEMRANHCRLDLVVFATIINVLHHAKRYQEARHVFSLMEEAGVEPDDGILLRMSGMLRALGLAEEADNVLQRAGRKTRRRRRASRQAVTEEDPIATDLKGGVEGPRTGEFGPSVIDRDASSSSVLLANGHESSHGCARSSQDAAESEGKERSDTCQGEAESGHYGATSAREADNKSTWIHNFLKKWKGLKRGVESTGQVEARGSEGRGERDNGLHEATRRRQSKIFKGKEEQGGGLSSSGVGMEREPTATKRRDCGGRGSDANGGGIGIEACEGGQGTKGIKKRSGERLRWSRSASSPVNGKTFSGVGLDCEDGFDEGGTGLSKNSGTGFVRDGGGRVRNVDGMRHLGSDEVGKFV